MKAKQEKKSGKQSSEFLPDYTFSREKGIVGGVAFYAANVKSKESRASCQPITYAGQYGGKEKRR
jgi:hypothetical protein